MNSQKIMKVNELSTPTTPTNDKIKIFTKPPSQPARLLLKYFWVIEYDSPTGSYVKQYSNIPEDGILAQSKDVSE